MQRQTSVIEVKNLWKVFGNAAKNLDVTDTKSLLEAEANGGVIAVRNVSFKVNRGEVFPESVIIKFQKTLYE